MLRYVDICVLTRCNLHCSHCFATSFNKAGEEPLSLRQWRDIAGQCMRMGAVTFGITGGEPLLYKDLAQLVRTIYPWENLITVNSNGTLLNDRLAKEFYDSGVDIFQVSMDSFDSQEHDAFRGQKGAYRKTLSSIDIAQRNGLKVTIVCTVSHQSIRSKGVMRLIEFAKKKGVLVILSRATPAGEWLGRTDILLTKDDQGYMYGLTGRFAHVRTDMETNLGRYGCSAATEKVYITAYGDVIPCPFMHISFGNIREEPIETIRNRMLSIPRLNCYSQTCHVAEDRDFIENVLTATFKAKNIIGWKDCFY